MKKIKVLMPAAEMAPIAKVGGLADVVGSLPPALKKLGLDVRLILPLYGSIDRKKYSIKKTLSNITVPSNGQKLKINIWETKLSGNRIYFIENKKYFADKDIYSTNDTERFLFFSLAVIKVMPAIKFIPDIIHCHDFHTGLIPDLLKTSADKKIKDIKTLYTIHNLNHQGQAGVGVLKTGNLSQNSLEILNRDASDGDINFMVQGIIGSDLVNTVSPTYAREIGAGEESAGLEKIINENSQKISGIINGIDTIFFNPETDKNIYKKYSRTTLKIKPENKLKLQKLFGLPEDKNIAVAGLISRLAWQKGLELIDETSAELPCQMVFLGTGEKKYEDELKKLAQKYPKKIAVNIGFDAKLAQQIYAGSDIFLMPSRFEPCGLGQMIAMRYGTIPLVRATGGLADTVDNKVGFTFSDFSAEAFFETLKSALEIYYHQPKLWLEMQKNCMKKDFTWNKSAKEYLNLYKKLLNPGFLPSRE